MVDKVLVARKQSCFVTIFHICIIRVVQLNAIHNSKLVAMFGHCSKIAIEICEACVRGSGSQQDINRVQIAINEPMLVGEGEEYTSSRLAKGALNLISCC